MPHIWYDSEEGDRCPRFGWVPTPIPIGEIFYLTNRRSFKTVFFPSHFGTRAASFHSALVTNPSHVLLETLA